MPTHTLQASILDAWLGDGREIALLDAREHGQYGEGHPFFAVSLPYSRLELDAPRLLPRAATRIVVFDDDDGVASIAARRLTALGYTDVHVLEGGAAAWARAGYPLFKGVNVPSKTFGEWVEHRRGTPHITPQELQRRQQVGEALLLLDGRTLDEHHKRTIPGSIPVPNGELAARLDALLDSPSTPIIVHCAGRTRSIIGAQTLIDLGVPNPVLALENGTQGWELAGFTLETASRRELPERSPINVERQAQAAALAARHGAPRLSVEAAQRWLDDAERTTYVLDVRTFDEFQRATLAGARHAPGGQLVQATDQFIAVRGSRVLLLDDDAIRAPVAASWLRQLGYQAATVEGGITAVLNVPARVPEAKLATLDTLDAAALSARAASFDTVLDLRGALSHRRGHPAGSAWAIRPRLRELVKDSRSALLVADDPALAALAALDLREAGVTLVAYASWAGWQAAGLPTAANAAEPSDAEAIDTLFFVHDRHEGNLDAARRYLEWEMQLLSQCRPQELAQFQG